LGTTEKNCRSRLRKRFFSSFDGSFDGFWGVVRTSGATGEGVAPFAVLTDEPAIGNHEFEQVREGPG
jgi:hypothetical protein